MNKNDTPRRCYICGSPVKVEKNISWYRIKCTNCALDFGRYWFESKPTLIRCWNNWISKEDARRI